MGLYDGWTDHELCEELEALDDSLAESGGRRMTDWEMKFVADVAISRLKSSHDIFSPLSEKQREKCVQILEKYDDE